MLSGRSRRLWTRVLSSGLFRHEIRAEDDPSDPTPTAPSIANRRGDRTTPAKLPADSLRRAVASPRPPRAPRGDGRCGRRRPPPPVTAITVDHAARRPLRTSSVRLDGDDAVLVPTPDYPRSGRIRPGGPSIDVAATAIDDLYAALRRHDVPRRARTCVLTCPAACPVETAAVNGRRQDPTRSRDRRGRRGQTDAPLSDSPPRRGPRAMLLVQLTLRQANAYAERRYGESP